jgi:hypothetical protein
MKNFTQILLFVICIILLTILTIGITLISPFIIGFVVGFIIVNLIIDICQDAFIKEEMEDKLYKENKVIEYKTKLEIEKIDDED